MVNSYSKSGNMKITEEKEIDGIKRKVVYREFGGKWCWICGGYNGVTKHHVIPKSLNPITNVLIPLCPECHKKVHGLIKFKEEKDE